MKPLLHFLWTCLTFTARTLYASLIYLNESLERLANQAPAKKGYDASFLSPSKVLSSFNKGYCLTGTTSLSTSDSHLHSMIIGGSGYGKSSVIIIPSIFNLAKHGHSLCVHDPSGELYKTVAAFLNQQGYTIKLLHFARPEVSDGYNPLPRVSTSSEIYKVATIFVQTKMGKSSTDEFWNSQAIAFIALMISILKKWDIQYQTFANVKHLVDSFQAEPDGMDRIVAECGDEHILKEYKNFLRTEKKVMANIISTCRSALSLFMDESVQKVTSFDTIGNFESFREQKTALFILNKTADSNYYGSLSSTFFLQFFNHIMNGAIPPKGSRSIFFLIDEASALYLPTTLQIACANLRKYSAGMMLVWQDFNQVIHLYGKHEAEAIRANCYAKVYFPGQPIETAKELEAMLGKREYKDDQGNTHTRVLLTADEIQTMPKNKALIYCGSHRAIYTSMTPFFKNFTFKKLSALPRPERPCLLPFEQVPLLPLSNEHNDEEDTH